MTGNSNEKGSDELKKKKRLVEKYGVLLFFLLTFCITWTFDFIGIIFIEIYYPFLVAGAFGPLLAALILVYAQEGKPGVKIFLRSIKEYKGALWLIGAILIYGGALLLGSWISLLMGADTVNPYRETGILFFILESVLIFLVVTLLTGGNEEPGWRGYALPRLLERFNPFWAGLLLGMIWAVWHIPSTFMPTLQGLIPFYLYFPHIVFLSIIFTWLFLRTEGSVLYAILFHGAINFMTGLVFTFVEFSFDQFIFAITLLVFLEAAFVGILLYVERILFFKFPSSANKE